MFLASDSEHLTMQYGSFNQGIAFAKENIDSLAAKAAAEGRPFRVIDVGGGHSGDLWDGRVTAVVDLLKNTDLADDVEFFKADICSEIAWKNIEADLLKDGKYDFCICRHTLEDLNNPEVTTRWLSKIATHGYIGVPSYLTELGRSSDHQIGNEWVVEGSTRVIAAARGYTHHKWIFFSSPTGAVLAYPKLSWVDALADNFYLEAYIAQDIFGGFFNNDYFPQDMSFCWKDKPDIIYLNCSLQVEMRWGNGPAISKALGILLPANIKDVPLEIIQDWTFLAMVAAVCHIPNSALDGYRELQKSIWKQCVDLGIVKADVPFERMPWYSIMLAKRNGQLKDTGDAGDPRAAEHGKDFKELLEKSRRKRNEPTGD